MGITFEHMDWNRPVMSSQKIIMFKKYADKFFWWDGDDWIETDWPPMDMKFEYIEDIK